MESGIAEAEERIMREVDGSYAVFKDADRCDRDLKRCELAAMQGFRDPHVVAPRAWRCTCVRASTLARHEAGLARAGVA